MSEPTKDQIYALRTLDAIVNNLTVLMECAWIEWRSGNGAEAALQWIYNHLDNIGQLPDESITDAEAHYKSERIEPILPKSVGEPAPKYEVRVAGPDDVYTFPDEISALREANGINKLFLADLLKHPNDMVLCVATVHEFAPEAAAKEQ